jgi:hypothetical protein
MLLAAMLAMVLAAAAPAFAQAIAGDVSVQYVDCSQVQAAAAAQGQYGDAESEAQGVSNAASASIAQELNITQEQVNACLGGVAAGGDIVTKVGGSATAAAAAAAAGGGGGGGAAGAAGAAAGGALPETGGASLLALGAGALLVAGGLLARRIVR